MAGISAVAGSLTQWLNMTSTVSTAVSKVASVRNEVNSMRNVIQRGTLSGNARLAAEAALQEKLVELFDVSSLSTGVWGEAITKAQNLANASPYFSVINPLWYNQNVLNLIKQYAAKGQSLPLILANNLGYSFGQNVPASVAAEVAKTIPIT